MRSYRAPVGPQRLALTMGPETSQRRAVSTVIATQSKRAGHVAKVRSWGICAGRPGASPPVRKASAAAAKPEVVEPRRGTCAEDNVAALQFRWVVLESEPANDLRRW